MRINLIAAVAFDGSIGRGNELIWHLSADLRFFKETTMGHPVIMGRKTFESIGRALPGRTNIVISRSNPELPEGVLLAHSLDEALNLAKEDCFVIGGAQIYALAMAQADRLYITRVFTTAPDADAFFPPILADEWKIVSEGEILKDEKSGLEFRFESYERECQSDDRLA